MGITSETHLGETQVVVAILPASAYSWLILQYIQKRSCKAPYIVSYHLVSNSSQIIQTTLRNNWIVYTLHLFHEYYVSQRQAFKDGQAVNSSLHLIHTR